MVEDKTLDKRYQEIINKDPEDIVLNDARYLEEMFLDIVKDNAKFVKSLKIINNQITKEEYDESVKRQNIVKEVYNNFDRVRDTFIDNFNKDKDIDKQIDKDITIFLNNEVDDVEILKVVDVFGFHIDKVFDKEITVKEDVSEKYKDILI